jgi:hypothetical protein
MVTFVIHLRPMPGVDGIHALRHLLKTSLRKYGLRCVLVREQQHEQSIQKGRTDAHHVQKLQTF